MHTERSTGHTPELADLETLLETVSDGFLAIDQDWRIRYVNAAAGRILPESRAALVGRSVWEVYPGLAGHPLETLYRETLAGGRSGSLTVWYPDHQRWYQVTATPISSGLGVCFRDVTAARRMEERTAAEREALQALIDANPHGAHIVDGSFRIRYANAATRATFASIRPLIGADLRAVIHCIWPAEIADRLVGIYEHTLRTGEPYEENGTLGRRTDIERTESYDWRIERIALPGGEMGIATYFYDLTEREQRLLELTARERRQQLLVALGDLLQGLSTPRAILNAAARVIVEHLHAHRAGYGMDLGDGEHVEVVEDFAAGLTNIPGRYRYADYDPRLLACMRARRPFLRQDVATAPDLTPAQKAAYAALGIGAAAHVPLVRDGELRAILFVHDRGPRTWLPEEVAVLTEVAARTWDAIERSRAEAALKTSAETLGLFIEHAPVAIAMFDRRMRYVAASRRFISEYRLAPEQVAAHGAIDGAPGFPERWRAVIQRGLAGATERADAEPFPRADGGVDWVHWEMRPWYEGDGRIGGVLLFAENVTARKTIEQTLAAQRALLASALAAGNAGAFEWDIVGGSNRWSPELERLYGIEPGSFGGTLEAWSALVHPEDRERVPAIVEHALETGILDDAWRILRGDGALRWIRARGSVEYDAVGRPLRLLGINIDVTAQKRAEQALRASEEAHRIAAEALREADRRKDVFLATLSHELRNPLAPLRTAAQLLGDTRLDARKLAWAQSVIQRQVAHMARLLDDLLDVARITQGKLSLRFEQVSLGPIVEAAVETARPLIDRKQHRLSVSTPPEPLLLHADPLRLAQVLANLLNNAAKYTDPGGEIGLEARREAGQLVITVRDNGIGLPAQSPDTLFEMFSQAEGGGGRTEGGLGIGLALVKGLTELHGGSVSARSDGPGRGTTFTLMLPLSAASGDDVVEKCPAQAPEPRRRVLVVDDNRDGADGLAMLLELAGHEVRVAYDGPSGLAVAAEVHPDVALLDLGMPGMNGFALARAIRAEDWGREMTLAALTGWGQDEDRRCAREAGFDHHLTKPVDPVQVHALLAAAARHNPDIGLSAARH